MTECPYERNTYMENSPTNLTIGKIKSFSRPQFDEWADKFRKEVTYSWDEFGVPIEPGRSADAIVRDFRSLANYDVTKLVKADETTGELDCLTNPGTGNKCVQFFPTMLKTKDISNGTLDGVSLYKYFADDDYRSDFKHYLYRQFRIDFLKMLSDDNLRIMDRPRVFRMSFPFRPAGNFPPVVAKHLYLRFTQHIEDQDNVVIYDPCSGWGGRILGAMACCNERQVHYVGTDPNTDHWMSSLEITKYAYLADYFNGNVRGRYKNTYELFQSGSEDICDNPEFQKYKGKLDLVFTSPPYFAAEGYSDDETQSYNRYRTYEEWRDLYLKKTLETCVSYLKEGRWLIWNIADVVFSNKYLPMEADTIAILEELGVEYHGKLKMVLPTPPGGNKENEDGIPTTKNFCRIDGRVKKFEPILMFWKPVENQTEETKGYVPTFEEMLNTESD